jgi:hypothetical protein
LEKAWFYGNLASFNFGFANPADLVNGYTFVYTHNCSGDYYYGQGYATTGQVAAAAVPGGSRILPVRGYGLPLCP